MSLLMGRSSSQEIAVSNVSTHTLQHTATHCSTLQHTATYCSTLQRIATQRARIGGTNTLQPTATHCNTLHHYCWDIHRPTNSPIQRINAQLECLIYIDHFVQKSPIIGGSLTGKKKPAV